MWRNVGGIDRGESRAEIVQHLVTWYLLGASTLVRLQWAYRAVEWFDHLDSSGDYDERL